MNPRATLLILALAGFAVALLLWSMGRSARPGADAAGGGATLAAPLRGARTAAGETEAGALGEGTERTDAAGAARDPRVLKLFEGLTGGVRRGKISKQAIEAFLESRQRSGGSLLAAWQESGDDAYLREAAERFPDDPMVQAAALLSSTFAGERAVWVERLKQSDPDNPLVHWLAAADHFGGKRSAEAVAELLGAEGKMDFKSYLRSGIDERRALFESAGMEPLQAQIEAQFGSRYDYLQSLQSANRGIDAEVKALRERGDTQTAQDLSATAVNLGRMLNDHERGTLLEQLVGISIESAALKQIPTGEAVPLLGVTAAQRQAELEARKKELSEMGRVAGEVIKGQATLEVVEEYFQRQQRDGELAALRWLAAQRPVPR